MQLSLLLAVVLAAPFALGVPMLETRQSNLQTFTGSQGGSPPPITNSGDATRPFEVNGNTFVNFAAAAQRSCDIQQNACSNAANSGKGGSVSVCQAQQTACNAAASSGASSPGASSPGATSTTSAPATATSAAIGANVGSDTCTE
ncbi:hypothetical protein MMC25_004415 [Agyrium rufum]|nr:hypothetical protein [Agyrium rufum]